MESRLVQLENSFVYEVTRAMALPQTKIMRGLVRRLFGRAIHRFSEILFEFDRHVEQQGAMAGVRWLLPYFVAGYQANGTHIIPEKGPLIIAANHPASYDGMIIAAHVPRTDLKIMVGEIPPYRYLPHISQHMIFSPQVKNTVGRMQTVRHAIRHLKDGGSLLIFPRGGIEPDPAFMSNPESEFGRWSRSLEIFIRHVPQTRVLITAVSGVISKTIYQHPITWFRRSRPDKQRLAFMYQIIRQVSTGRELFGLTPRVTFGELLFSTDQSNLLTEIECSARNTMKRHIASFQQTWA